MRYIGIPFPNEKAYYIMRETTEAAEFIPAYCSCRLYLGDQVLLCIELVRWSHTAVRGNSWMKQVSMAVLGKIFVF